MTMYLRPGIPVSAETRQHWKDAGFTIMRAPRRGRERSRVQFQEGDLLLNYGSTTPLTDSIQDVTPHVLNVPQLVSRTRVENVVQYIGQWMPETVVCRSTDSDAQQAYRNITTRGEHRNVIVKMNGMKGANKWVVDESGEVRWCEGPAMEEALRAPFVVQKFIHPATEYRLITLQVPGVMGAPEVVAWSRKDTDPYNPQTEKVFHYLPRYTLPDDLRVMVLEAHVALGLDYVGWDVLYERHGESGYRPDGGALPAPKYYIIEANSAPGIGDVVGRRLKKKLAEWMGENA